MSVVSEHALLRLDAVNKQYREGDSRRQVLRDLHLCVRRGEIVALLGRSGSGKSTLLNIIAGIDDADSGEIRCGDVNVGALAEPHRTRWRRRCVGFVFQFFNLIPTLTASENIRLPLALNGVDTPARRADVDALLDAVGLRGRGDSFPERLSGGEQQRLALLRALIHRPTLLLADEPTGNLDSATGDQVLTLLLRLAREHGATALLVTHSDAVATRADRVLRLHNGRFCAAA